MLKNLLNKTTTSKTDVVMAFAGALVGVWKAFDTLKDYKSEQTQEINQ